MAGANDLLVEEQRKTPAVRFGTLLPMLELWPITNQLTYADIHRSALPLKHPASNPCILSNRRCQIERQVRGKP